MEREPGTQPPHCKSDDDPRCSVGCVHESLHHSNSDRETTLKQRALELAPWPARELTTPPPRLADFGYSAEMIDMLAEVWQHRVEKLLESFEPKRFSSDTLRNLMDMKVNLGSFAAALKSKDVWVMNVVPEDGPNTLKKIYVRGLMGSVHSMSVNPTPTYTHELMIYCKPGLSFSDIAKKDCSAVDLLIEMDRIMRPSRLHNYP
ncbi:hypothetical protein NC652_012383 [Populus alba x Populus x berolinensis]|nr:hypothetical protein NC652_012383 [Populus alba x Populus x berolinensis]